MLETIKEECCENQCMKQLEMFMKTAYEQQRPLSEKSVPFLHH